MLVLMLGVGIGNIALGINFVLDIRASDNTPLAIVIASITGFSLAGPVISSLALFDVYGLLVSIVNAPFFLAFSPMWVLMGAYGISRFADLSWGNRPHESRSAAAAHRDAYMKTTSVLGMAYMALYLSANLFTGVLLICFGFLWQGTGVVLFFLLIGPYCLSSVFAVIYNMQYAARYRWCTWISARTRQRMMKSRATSTPALSDIPGKSSWR